MEFLPICQNSVPTKQYSTKNTNQNTNHQMPVNTRQTSSICENSRPCPPHLPTLPHAHMVFCLRNALDIDAVDCDELISFVNRNFIAEWPLFQGNKYHNIDWWGNEHELTEDFKAKALKMVCKHN
jgi:hypothetical protein